MYILTMIETVVVLVVFIISSSPALGSDGGSSKNNVSPKRKSSPVRRTVNYDYDDYCECPSYGASYYGGYCEKCDIPMPIRRLGEEYG